MLKTKTAVRQSFWDSHPEFRRFKSYSQNDYPTDVRVAFSEWVDCLLRGEQITEKMADNVTLK